ncbi:MAG: DUF11 domain-containing protein [Gemmatimonadetes bacterium]|nr:DUF11 domain-containing protein [Gemmatimonadota bacterium]
MKRTVLVPRFTLPLAAGLALLVGASQANAAGTPSGTPVINTATVDYLVGTIPQSTVTSNPDTFMVDNKVDHVVATTDLAIISVTPGAIDQIQTFSVTNNGNTVQDYSLTATHSATGAFGETETFDATAVRVFVDANGNDAYDSGTDTAGFIDELAADSSVTVFVLANIPLAQVDADVSSFDLTAQVASGGGTTVQGGDITSDDSGAADLPGTVQIVFADGAGTATGDVANDGQHSSKNGYKVASAALNVVKSSLVTNDPINLGVNPKSIPGATVDYTIDLTNNGTSSADGVQVVDQIPANTAFLVGSVSTTPLTAVVTYSSDGGTTYTHVPVAGANGEDASVTHVRVTYVTIAASGGTAQAVFQVLIL